MEATYKPYVKYIKCDSFIYLNVLITSTMELRPIILQMAHFKTFNC